MSDQQEYVVLVDLQDKQIGLMEKYQAHKEAKLHRAFSVFILKKVLGEVYILLQQRALTKYHCPGMWSNTCCSHQREHETTMQAAMRRMQEEMGFICELQQVGSFVYKAEFDNGLTEHEFDHVLIGYYNDAVINFNPDEVNDYAWVTKDELLLAIKQDPIKYTPWLPLALNIITPFL